MAAPAEKEGLTLSPKALGAIIAAALTFGGGGVAVMEHGTARASAGNGPCPSTTELGQVRERLVAVETTVAGVKDDVKDMNKKIDSLVALQVKR